MIIPNTSYKGNSQLKKHEVEQEYTKEEIEEFIKCANDITYFAQNYVKIVHPDRGLIPFDLYPFQEKMLEHLNENRNSILLASRQVGKCFFQENQIIIKNKVTQEVYEISIGDFFKMCSHS